MKAIRLLENRLDKAMIKYNESLSIRKTYDIILKKLKEERVVFDKQLSSLEEQVKDKQGELGEMLLLSHDAKVAKQNAAKDLSEHQAQIHALRHQRLGEIQAQKEAVEKRVSSQEEALKDKQANMVAKPLKAMKGSKEKQRLAIYEEAMQQIREATGVSDINEVIVKLASQEETLENLRDVKQTNEKKLLALTDKRQQVKDDLEKMKLEGLEAMTRKQVDDMERSLAQAEQKHVLAKQNHDQATKMLLDLQAGIEHLCGKLNEIKLD